MRRLFLPLLLSFLPAAGSADPGRDLDFYDFERASLEEIINIHTGVASRLEFAARQAPGIITVITREELVNSGARDLIDALRLVPGLDFGVDVESLLGPGVRGNWAHEGKALVLVDDQRYNESFFGTAQLERISVEQVERIEIVRGPGSVIYGGSAGLGVIKITTRCAKSIQKADAVFSAGAAAGARTGHAANLAAAWAGRDYEFTAQAYQSGQVRADRRYTAFDGSSYSMRDNSDMETRSLNLGFRRGGLGLRLIADQHRTWQRDGYSTSTYSNALQRNFDAYFAEAKYEFKPGDTLTVTPVLNYSYQQPYTGYNQAFYFRDKESHYLKGAVTAVYAASASTRFSGGAEASLDHARLDARTPPSVLFSGGRRTAEYVNAAVFAEGVAEYSFGMLSAGARYDKHEEFAPAFSPRLAWTKALDRSHFKAIYSGAFRAPGIDNFQMNPGLKPEKAYVAEVEAGCRAAEDIYAAINLFDIRIKDPIVFYIDTPSPGNPFGQYYGNYGKTGTRGFELNARMKKDWGYSDLSYSYYMAVGNKVDFYDAGAGTRALLAFPRHKVSLNSSFRITPKFSVNPSAVYYGERHGYYTYGRVRNYGDSLLANVNFLLKGLAGGRAEVSLGVYDLLNSGYKYLQPYDGGHAPLPARSREVRLRTAYKF